MVVQQTDRRTYAARFRAAQRVHALRRLSVLFLGVVLLCNSTPAAGQDNYSPFSFANVSYTYAWFDGGDSGDGVTKGASVSKSYSLPGMPLFLSGFANFSKADDSVKLDPALLPENLDQSTRDRLLKEKLQLEQNILRGGILAGYESRGNRHRMFYALLGYERNDFEIALGVIQIDEDRYGGPVYGVGTLLQITERNTVDLRFTKIDYRGSDAAKDASYSTASIGNYFSIGGGVAVSLGVSYNESPSVDTSAIHVGLKWMFE